MSVLNDVAHKMTEFREQNAYTPRTIVAGYETFNMPRKALTGACDACTVPGSKGNPLTLFGLEVEVDETRKYRLEVH